MRILHAGERKGVRSASAAPNGRAALSRRSRRRRQRTLCSGCCRSRPKADLTVTGIKRSLVLVTTERAAVSCAG